jgi:hypothetical protein
LTIDDRRCTTIVMTAKKHTGVRIDDDIIERVEAYAARMTKETGIEVNRATALRALLVKGLEVVEHQPRRKK